MPLENPPDEHTPVWMRDTTTGADAAKHPWVTRCNIRNCFWSVCADTEEDGYRKLEEHQMGDLCPLPLVNYENKVRVRSPLEGT